MGLALLAVREQSQAGQVAGPSTLLDAVVAAGEGPALAAALADSYASLRRTAGQGACYDAEGRPWVHTFLALPLSAAAISSHFSHR